ncbi:MAG: biopolymer transporter ExbD [Treponematales bacterium]
MRVFRKKRESFDAASASSDIAFLLIIYFLVIAGFNINRGFLLNLPAKDSVKAASEGGPLRFELDGSGGIVFQGAKITSEEAERVIATAGQPQAVALAAAKRAPWRAVVAFVERAQKLRIENFSFTMREEP